MDNWKPDGTELIQIIEKVCKGDEEAIRFLNNIFVELLFQRGYSINNHYHVSFMQSAFLGLISTAPSSTNAFLLSCLDITIGMSLCDTATPDFKTIILPAFLNTIKDFYLSQKNATLKNSEENSEFWSNISEMWVNIIESRAYLDPIYGGDNALEIALKIEAHLIMLNLLNKK
ncbi:hypothetical protein [Succinispira mobilis]|uniref:hypothetical protein n=1 Tax=Succinispira mobilis TaxID=78120 RepID=UPI00036D0E05|nr:hypothetical protein [Succinispira mobilis]